MNKDEYIEWIENNHDELVKGFLNELSDAFGEYCLEEYQNALNDQADKDYDRHLDEQAERLKGMEEK